MKKIKRPGQITIGLTIALAWGPVFAKPPEEQLLAKGFSHLRLRDFDFFRDTMRIRVVHR